MKIISIVSSGRQNGNTERLAKMLENRLQKVATEHSAELEIEHINLHNQDVRFCRGCRVCLDKGENDCPVRDDASKIRNRIRDADGLILASPVYVEDVNGVMKNWIDRMAFLSHRPDLYGKFAVIMTTSGSGSSNRSIETMKNALISWGVEVVQSKKFRMGALMPDAKMEEQYDEETEKTALLFFEKIQKTEREKPTLFSLISFHIQQKYYRDGKNAGIVDRRYWDSHGWLDAKACYFFPVRSAKLKLWAAKILGGILSRIFY